MKFSERWLREWISPDADTQALADRLTMAGLEVEGIEPAAGDCRNVVVAAVRDVQPHPDADKLRVCRVDDGSEERNVVCGAPNVRAGMQVPYARVGARLADGGKIRRAKIRGVESGGMLCSAEELGMADSSDGLLELPPDLEIGQDIGELLALDDKVIELALTPNRGDCLSIAGIARELGALYSIAVDAPQIGVVPPLIDERTNVVIEAGDACPRYVCRVLRNVDVSAQTPLWMSERLRRSGIRSIDPVVDVTNYVLLELGQPMHAFDLDALEGGIIVRRANEGEQLTLLDEQVLSLASDDLVIADHSKALALAGIMGGHGSGVTRQTRNVLLESAYFAPLAIAGGARAHGLRTDSSHRFERGVDFGLQERALERATALLVEICGARPGPTHSVENVEHLPKQTPIELRIERMHAVLGLDIPQDKTRSILQQLGLTVTRSGDVWQAVPPSWRFDLSIEADLIEEVARVHGYDQVPVRQQSAALTMYRRSETDLRISDMRRRLVDLGYQEAITYSFVDPGLQSLLEPDTRPVELANPISSDMAVMRTTLWCGLLPAIQYNLKRQQTRVRLFETGLCFRADGGELRQQRVIAGAVTGDRHPSNWTSKAVAVDFFDVKGDVETLLAELHALETYRFESAERSALHPGQSARIVRDAAVVGWVGRLHPSIQGALDITQAVYLFELNFAQIAKRNLPKFKALSKFPEVRRDLAMLVDRKLPASDLTGTVKEVAGGLLQNLMLFDMYIGEGIDSEKKSLAIGMVLQHSDRTLTDEEVSDLERTVIQALCERHGAQLRN